MAFSMALTCSIVASYFEVLKKMHTSLCWARKSLNKSKYIFCSPVFEEGDEILPNTLDQKEADGIVE